MENTMKYFIAILSLLLLVGVVEADTDMFSLLIDSASTNAAASTGDVETNKFVHGMLEAIIIDIGGAVTPTVTVSVATIASGGGQARTLYTGRALTADTVVYPRAAVSDTTGTAFPNGTNVLAKIPIYGKVKFSAYASNETNSANPITVQGYVIFDK